MLTLDIRQCPAKNWVTSDESCFMDAIAQFLSFNDALKLAPAFGKDNLFLLWLFIFMNILMDSLLMQFIYIQNCRMCLRKKILCQYFVVFCPAWVSLSLHSTKNLKKIWDKVFKSGPSKVCGKWPLKVFTWSTLEYFVPYKTTPDTLN